MSSSPQFDVVLNWPTGSNASMGPPPVAGSEVGMRPGSLLCAAVASSFGSILGDMLRAAGLPYTSLQVHANGLVAGDPRVTKFATVTVNPTIYGADASRRRAYEQAATSARNHCPIGRSIRGNVAYVVGAVCLIGSLSEFAAAV